MRGIPCAESQREQPGRWRCCSSASTKSQRPSISSQRGRYQVRREASSPSCGRELALHGAVLERGWRCEGVARSSKTCACLPCATRLAEVLHGAVEMCTATCKGVAWSYVSVHECYMKLYECACLHGHCMDLCGCACLRGCCLEPCECACLHAWILQEAECARLHACSIDIARSSVCAHTLCCSAGVRACPGTMHSLHGHRAAPDLGFGHQNCPQDHVATVGATTATGQR